jgi:hypothetical protein
LASKSDPRERDRPARLCRNGLLPSLFGYESLASLAANQLPIAPRRGLRTLRTNRATTHEGFYAGVFSDHHGTPPLTKHPVTALQPGWTSEVARVRYETPPGMVRMNRRRMPQAR